MGAILAGFACRIPSTVTSSIGARKHEEVPLPSHPHITVTEQDIADRDVIIVGDIHGCLEELQALHRIIDTRYGPNCVYVFVGDIINKGPYNVETLKFVRGLENCYVVRGNHEERVIKEWVDVKNGKLQCFSPFYAWMSDLTEDDMDFLMELPYTIQMPSLDIIVVHAGFSPWKSLYYQSPKHMVSMRNMCDIDVLQPKETEDHTKGVPWASVWPGPQHVYFGHDARRRLQQYPFATGLDTGCLYGGSLTAVNVKRLDDGFNSVQAKKVHIVPGSGSKKKQ